MNRGAILPGLRDPPPNRSSARRRSSSWSAAQTGQRGRLAQDLHRLEQRRRDPLARDGGAQRPEGELGLDAQPVDDRARAARPRWRRRSSRCSEPSTPVPVSSMSPSAPMAASSTSPASSLSWARASSAISSCVVGRRRTGATRAVASVQQRHPRLDQRGDRLEPGQLAQRRVSPESTPSRLEVGQQPRGEVADRRARGCRRR